MMDVVCGVIEDENGRFLACLRPEGKHLAGRWEFPGGKVASGETHEAALIRELQEELAVEVAVGRAMNAVLWSDFSVSIRLLPFRCQIVGGELRAMEHAELRWCLPAEFDELSWAEADLPILAEIGREPETAGARGDG